MKDKSTNEQIDDIYKQYSKILESQKDMPNEFRVIVDANFWELLDFSFVSKGGYPIKEEKAEENGE